MKSSIRYLIALALPFTLYPCLVPKSRDAHVIAHGLTLATTVKELQDGLHASLNGMQTIRAESNPKERKQLAAVTKQDVLKAQTAIAKVSKTLSSLAYTKASTDEEKGLAPAHELQAEMQKLMTSLTQELADAHTALETCQGEYVDQVTNRLWKVHGTFNTLASLTKTEDVPAVHIPEQASHDRAHEIRARLLCIRELLAENKFTTDAEELTTAGQLDLFNELGKFMIDQPAVRNILANFTQFDIGLFLNQIKSDPKVFAQLRTFNPDVAAVIDSRWVRLALGAGRWGATLANNPLTNNFVTNNRLTRWVGLGPLNFAHRALEATLARMSHIQPSKQTNGDVPAYVVCMNEVWRSQEVAPTSQLNPFIGAFVAHRFGTEAPKPMMTRDDFLAKVELLDQYQRELAENTDRAAKLKPQINRLLKEIAPWMPVYGEHDALFEEAGNKLQEKVASSAAAPAPATGGYFSGWFSTAPEQDSETPKAMTSERFLMNCYYAHNQHRALTDECLDYLVNRVGLQDEATARPLLREFVEQHNSPDFANMFVRTIAMRHYIGFDPEFIEGIEHTVFSWWLRAVLNRPMPGIESRIHELTQQLKALDADAQLILDHEKSYTESINYHQEAWENAQPYAWWSYFNIFGYASRFYHGIRHWMATRGKSQLHATTIEKLHQFRFLAKELGSYQSQTTHILHGLKFGTQRPAKMIAGKLGMLLPAQLNTTNGACFIQRGGVQYFRIMKMAQTVDPLFWHCLDPNTRPKTSMHAHMMAATRPDHELPVLENAILTRIYDKAASLPVQFEVADVPHQAGAQCGYHALYNGLAIGGHLAASTDQAKFLDEAKKAIQASRNSAYIEWLDDLEIYNLCAPHIDTDKGNCTIIPDVRRYAEGREGLQQDILRDLEALQKNLLGTDDFTHVILRGNMQEGGMQSGHWVADIISRKGGKLKFVLADSLGMHKEDAKEFYRMLFTRKFTAIKDTGKLTAINEAITHLEHCQILKDGEYALLDPDNSRRSTRVLNTTVPALLDRILRNAETLMAATKGNGVWCSHGYIEPRLLVHDALQAILGAKDKDIVVYATKGNDRSSRIAKVALTTDQEIRIRGLNDQLRKLSD